MPYKSVSSNTRWRRKLAVILLALPCLLVAGTASASASSAPGAPVPSHLKPVPAPPRSSLRTEVGKALPAKPRIAPQSGGTWSVTLTASPNSLWPTQYSTLTATANHDVGPTPFYLLIWDETAQTYVGNPCGYGTTCTTAVTQPTSTLHNYMAVVSYPGGAGQQARSSDVGVNWLDVGVTLSANPTTPRVGATTTLTATTTRDIGPSPFDIEIFDASTRTKVGECYGGTICSATVSQRAATTHQYIAYVADYSTAYPPAGIQATSPPSFVTWSSWGYQVSLSVDLGPVGGPDTVTATANQDVGPTPYYIDIFNETNGTLLGRCGSGVSCSIPFTPSSAGDPLVAFVANGSPTFPPGGIVASSNVAYAFLRPTP